MKTHFLAAVLFALTSSAAVAQNITEKAMQDHPGHTGAGVTAQPTAIPSSGSATQKAMQDHPGVTGSASSFAPATNVPDNSLAAKVQRDRLQYN